MTSPMSSHSSQLVDAGGENVVQRGEAAAERLGDAGADVQNSQAV